MPKQQYIVEVDADPHGFWEGSIVDAAGNSVPSSVIRVIQSNLGYLAEVAAAKEASQQLQAGKLYWCRTKRGVGYVIIESIENHVVMVKEADKTGKVDQSLASYQFFSPQRLVLAKNQPPQQ